MSSQRVWRAIGLVGSLLLVIFFIREPSWPTPDKILLFLTFVFMALGQAKDMLKRLVPFVLLLLIYESFRGLADNLNKRVNFLWMPHTDEKLFGVLPTAKLQEWWWHGHVQWYDFVFYGVYMLHFIMPITLAILVWKLCDAYYWRVVWSYIVLSFAGFITYFLFPAAPPWMASDMHYIQPITHISNYIWASLGFHNFNLAYSKIAPNPVAAVPSLHAAYSTIFVIFITKLFGWKWGAIALVYPLLIVVGTVYMGEHYVIDAILGIGYAFGSYFLVIWAYPKLAPRVTSYFSRLSKLVNKLV